MPINLLERLNERRKRILQMIRNVADEADEESDTGKLVELTEGLRATEQLIGRLKSDLADAESLLNSEDPITTTNRKSAPLPESVYARERVAGRGYGSAIRSDFLLRAEKRGIRFAPVKGSIYSAAGKTVGIAVATERQLNRWFLGLPEGAFKAAVLLCQTKSGRTLEICLPEAFFERYGRQLSRSTGQIKFNVVNRSGNIFLTIPEMTPVDVDRYEGALAQLLQ